MIKWAIRRIAPTEAPVSNKLSARTKYLHEDFTMGFPKPYPTEWPDPADYPDIPFDPNKFSPKGDPEPDDPDERGNVEPMPEYSHFYAVTWAVNHACNLHCTHC